MYIQYGKETNIETNFEINIFSHNILSNEFVNHITAKH